MGVLELEAYCVNDPKWSIFWTRLIDLGVAMAWACAAGSTYQMHCYWATAMLAVLSISYLIDYAKRPQ